MSEEPMVPGDNGIPELRAPQTPGEWLRAERERQGRTVQQIAEEMHLGPHMVEAMEKDQFSVLGAPVFARGHLRKYATLLALPVDRVQDLYLALTDRPKDEDPVPITQRAPEPFKAMSPDSRQRRDMQLPFAWTTGIGALGLLAVSVLIWWFVRDTPDSVPTQEAATSVPEPIVETVPTVVAQPDDPAAVSGVSAPPAPSAPAAGKTQSPPRTKLKLRFSFAEESWVEVYDSRGTRLLYDVGQPGQSRTVEVDAPAQIVLGQAAGVTTEVNGKSVEVPSKRVSGQVARFTVGPDGGVQ